MRALIVDDESMWRSILSSAVAKLGYETRTIDKASEAEPLIREGAFDLLLLDLQLENVAGMRLLQLVESDDELARRTIVVTGFGLIGRALSTRVPVVSKTDLGELLPAIRRIASEPAVPGAAQP